MPREIIIYFISAICFIVIVAGIVQSVVQLKKRG